MKIIIIKFLVGQVGMKKMYHKRIIFKILSIFQGIIVIDKNIVNTK